MFDDIGGKLKSFAKGVMVFSVMCFVFLGIYIGSETDSVIVPILLVLTGLLIGWVAAIGVYGLGQLIENSDKMVDNSEKLLKIYRSGEIEKRLKELEEKKNKGEISVADFERQKSSLLWNQW